MGCQPTAVKGNRTIVFGERFIVDCQDQDTSRSTDETNSLFGKS